MSVISLTSEYALRAMVYLTREAGRPTTTRRIAAGTQVPGRYRTKVMWALTTAGLVEARRGPDGGHTLARPPAEVTVLDVIRAMEHKRRVVPYPLCTARGPCALHRRLDEGIGLIESLFRRTTLD
jgi:Rrf2 family protein